MSLGHSLKLLCAALLVLMANAAQSDESAPAFDQGGSAEAVKRLVPVYMGTLFTIVDEPVITGDSATVRARIVDQQCDLVMKLTPRPGKHAASEWRVSQTTCAIARQAR